MKTISCALHPRAAARSVRALLATFAASALATVGSAADTAAAKEPQLENYITAAAGGTLLNGDRAQFEKLRNEKKDGWGGVESFHFGRDLGNNTTLSADGRALVGNNDFNLDMRLTRENVGFVRVGFQQYRVWFDPSGGYFPPTNLFFQPEENDLHIDRGDLWMEAATTRPDQINFNIRYDFTFRRGLKDSTSWGDTNLTGGLGTRAIVPAFIRVREHRHIVRASAYRETEQTSWKVEGRYENQSQENSRNMRRQPLAPQERRLTHREDSDVDLFMVHGAVETRLGPTLTLGTGVAHYNLDNVISGSRIYGDVYDPVFSATMARRQARDEGFYNLEGTTHMKQTLANVSLMYTPTENWVIVPELRAQRTTWGGDAEFVETAVGTTAALITALEDVETESDKNFRDLTEGLEFRYTGFKNIALNAGVELTQSYGSLAEDLIDLETQVDTLYRTTDFRRDQQKFDVSAHWYPRAGLNFSAQYYWKGRQNSFHNTRTSLAPLGADRYPAYIANQDTEVDDYNVRMTWSPLLQVRSVTRYDYQDTKLRSQEVGLGFLDSGHVRTHMIGETVTWNPLARWYVQASGVLVYDTTTTPAHDLTGAATGIVLNSDNNYFNGDLATGYALDDRTDVTLNYAYYRANNYVDNSRFSQPYGADQRTHFVALTWFRRVSPTLNYTLRYAYAKNEDVTSGHNNDFRAHTVYGAVQYRF